MISSGLGESQHLLGEGLRLFLMREMPGPLDHLEPRAGNQRTISAAVGFAEHAVVRAPQKQRRDADAVQPALQPRIVEVRIPGEARRRLAGARRGEHFRVRQRLVVAGAGAGSQ